MQLSISDLKHWLHRDIARLDKLLFALAAFSEPVQVRDVMAIMTEAGLRIPTTWNPSGILAGSKGLAIRVPAGWEITEAGKAHLRNLGALKISPAALQVAVGIREHATRITNADTRAFVEEAIECYEAELYRSAVVMSWLAAVHVLQNEVVENHLSLFNAEAVRIDPKWKTAATADDLGRMKESDFLDRLAAISVIGKNVKEELQKALKLRNACGHPNSLKISANMTAGHLELLLLNVFSRASV